MYDDTLDSGFGGYKKQQNLNGAGGILAMGIISIVLMGIIGLILAIVAISKANSAISLYRDYPMDYTKTSYNQVIAGKTCAIISLCLMGLLLLIVMAN